jgi:hypothetical protein
MHVVDLAATFVVLAFAQACAAKVEAQNGQAKARERLGCVVDDFVVHGSSAERVRVAEEDGVSCAGRAGVEQGFEAASGAGEVLDGSDGFGGWLHGASVYLLILFFWSFIFLLSQILNGLCALSFLCPSW